MLWTCEYNRIPTHIRRNWREKNELSIFPIFDEDKFSELATANGLRGRQIQVIPGCPCKDSGAERLNPNMSIELDAAHFTCTCGQSCELLRMWQESMVEYSRSISSDSSCSIHSQINSIEAPDDDLPVSLASLR